MSESATEVKTYFGLVRDFYSEFLGVKYSATSTANRNV